MVEIEFPQNGLGCIKGRSGPVLASSSARSLPSTPLCPGTHEKVILFIRTTLLIAMMQSHTSFDLTSYKPMASKAALLSDKM